MINIKMENDTEITQKYIIMTEMNDTTCEPTMEQVYKVIIADIHARYYRSCEKNVFFLTGTNEYNQKVIKNTNVKDKTPIDVSKEYSSQFEPLYQKLNISYDQFLHTMDKDHQKLVQSIFQKLLDKGDIYLGMYSGWYDTVEKKFISENEALWNDYKDRTMGLPFIKKEEETYFFKLPKYKDSLLEYFESNPSFIKHDQKYGFILKTIREDLKEDIPVARKEVPLGIPLLHNDHYIICNWFNTILSYFTGFESAEKVKCCPTSLHIIHKDMTWLYSVILSSVLFSLEITLPEKIISHGDVKNFFKNNMKWNQMRNPKDMLDKYPSDSLRLTLIHSNSLERIFFSEKKLVKDYNSDIVGTLCNIVRRCFDLLSHYTETKVPDVEIERIFNFEQLKEEIGKAFEKTDLYSAYSLAILSIKMINGYISSKKPWKITEETDPNLIQRNKIIRSALESLYLSTHFLIPFLPETSQKIFECLSIEPKSIFSLQFEKNLIVGANISFIKLDLLRK